MREGTNRQNERGDGEGDGKLAIDLPFSRLSVAPSPRRSVSPALLVIWASFLSRLSFGVISFALPIFAYKRLGLSLTQTGFRFRST